MSSRPLPAAPLSALDARVIRLQMQLQLPCQPATWTRLCAHPLSALPLCPPSTPPPSPHLGLARSACVHYKLKATLYNKGAFKSNLDGYAYLNVVRDEQGQRRMQHQVRGACL